MTFLARRLVSTVRFGPKLSARVYSECAHMSRVSEAGAVWQVRTRYSCTKARVEVFLLTS
jgi:hypothetical protein